MRSRFVLALLALGVLPAAAGCGVHITKSRAFTVTGVAAIEPDVDSRQGGFGERRLTNAAVTITGPRPEGAGITEIAHGATDGLGHFAVFVPHAAVPAHWDATYAWAVQITGQIHVNDAAHIISLHGAFQPNGTQLVQRDVNVASTVVARNLQWWLRTEAGTPSAATRMVAFAESPSGAGTNDTIFGLEARVRQLLADPPAGLSPVGQAMLTDLDGATAAVVQALTDNIQLSLNGSAVASTAAAGTASLASGASAALRITATHGGVPMGWSVDVTNEDEPAAAGAPATVAGMAPASPSTLTLTGKQAGAARIGASIAGTRGTGKAARLTLNVTP